MSLSIFSRTHLVLVFVLTLTIALAGCGGGSSSSSSESGAAPLTEDNTSLPNQIDALPVEPLSLQEEESLLFMREEEKLARDVYLYLYDIWGDKIFLNISNSEQQHTDAVLGLIEKYNLPDPAADTAVDEFENINLQDLYALLTAQGEASLIDALIVGATIEDLDINDLNTQLLLIDNADITLVYESLLKGSRNHLRAFTGRLTDLGFDYVPVYISQDEYDSIVSSPGEKGR